MSEELVNRTFRVTDTGIYGFFREYRCLSNFHLNPLVVDGITYPASEHAYMAQKTTDEVIRRVISNIPEPGAVKRYGQTIELRPDWEYYRVAAMLRVLLIKFQDEELKQILLGTRDKYLEETNWWNDTFWGVCNGQGLNMLGKCLMIVRDILRSTPWYP